MGKQSFGEREYTFGQRPGPRGVIESILVREYPDDSGGCFRVVDLGEGRMEGKGERGEGRWEPGPRG